MLVVKPAEDLEHLLRVLPSEGGLTDLGFCVCGGTLSDFVASLGRMMRRWCLDHNGKVQRVVIDVCAQQMRTGVTEEVPSKEWVDGCGIPSSVTIEWIFWYYSPEEDFPLVEIAEGDVSSSLITEVRFRTTDGWRTDAHEDR